MSGGPRGEQPVDADPASDEGFLSTVDAGTAVTPDPFLAEVARIPERPGVPLPGPVPRPGDQLGRFTLLAELGRGGMGVVYAAEDRTLGREVALKVLPTSGDDERRRRFLGEARSAAALTHAGIATVYEVGEVEGHAFIAMELVRGRTLRAALDQAVREGGPSGALPLAEALRVARAIVAALARAHARGVVHRDLKPENVMIAEDGQVKLLDFGLAKQIAVTSLDAVVVGREAAASPGPAGLASDRPGGGPPGAPGSGLMTEAGRIVGTPGYMSPEQARGGPVDARSDVFSFGVMLYELGTGARPFTGATTAELFVALERDEPVPPSRLAPGLPPALERVILRCLRKGAAERYADAGALLPDLDRCAEARPSRPLSLRAGMVAVVLAITFVATLGLGSRRTAPAAATSAAAPGPSSSNPAALAAYREGLAALRLGTKCTTSFERALELDPQLTAAHVQMATMAMFGSAEPAREHFLKAELARGSLDDPDRALLDAVEPVAHRQPSDWAESKRRIAALIERSPGDPWLWHLLAGGAANYDDFEEAARDEARAIALDPGFAEASSYMALMLAYLGRFGEAQAAVDQCLALNPGAEACLGMRTHLQDDRGACEDMEATARQMITSSAEPRWGYSVLANALAARERPMAMVREAARQAEEGLGSLPLVVERTQKKETIANKARMAIFEGDFVAAEQIAREYAALVAGSRRQAAHGSAALVLANIFEETGRPVEAAEVALAFLDRRDAWEPEPSGEDMALASDATSALLRTVVRGGLLGRDEAAARREGWLRVWEARITPVSRNFLWMYAYARVADTMEDAVAALAALKDPGGLPPFRPETLIGVDVGRTYLLAGRPDDALPWLEHATRTCMVLHFPFQHVHARLLLAETREAKGDKAGACRDYQSVITRWGRARPSSVTAERAAARAAALGCPR